MNKTKLLILIFFPLILSCVSKQSNTELPYIIEKLQTDTIYNVSLGDCFEFKNNQLPNFGFTMLEIIRFSDNNIEYSIVPIKLDTASNGINRFINGKTKVGKSNDYANSNGISLGLFSFSFLSQNEFKDIYKELNKIGSIKIIEKYNRTQSGTVEPDVKGIKKHLDFWNTRFYKMEDEDVKNIIVK